MQNERLNELEIKFSHQDLLLDQLNKIVSNQQIQIEKLQKEILEIKIMSSENGTQVNRSLEDDVPPHY